MKGYFLEAQKRVLKEKVVWADWGRGGVYLSDGENKHELNNTNDFFDFVADNYKGWTLIAEHAHIGVAATSGSMAQKYPEECTASIKGLKYGYDRLKKADVKVLLSPQKSTPTYLSYFGCDTENKDDMNDACRSRDFVLKFPSVITGFQLPPKTYKETSLQKHERELKKEMNVSMNQSRSNGYGARDPYIVSKNHKLAANCTSQEGYTHTNVKLWNEQGIHYVDLTARWIYDNIDDILSKLPEMAQDIIGVKYDKKGNLTSFKMNQLYPIVSIFMGRSDFDEKYGGEYVNRELRFRRYKDPKTKNLIRWKQASRQFFCFNPFHEKGGVIASNIKFHGRKNWVVSQIEKDHPKVKFKTRREKNGKLSSRETALTKAEVLNNGHFEYWSEYNNKHKNLVRIIFNTVRDLVCKQNGLA